jgi:acyl carrier protein
MGIRDELLEMVIKEFDKTAEEILSVETWKDLNLTSLDSMELIFNIEDKYHIEIPDEEYPNLVNFEKLVAYMEEQIK